MNQANLLEQAHHGNSQAISHLINRSLQKQGITAAVEFDHGYLEVILESLELPPEDLATFVHQGLLKLKIETAYEASVYGRKAGEHFATWSRQFELNPRPSTDFVANLTPNSLQFDQAHQPLQSQPRPLTLTFATEDGGTVHLDLALVIGIFGSTLLILGAFTPILNLPLAGNMTFFRNGSEEGYALLLCAIASIIFLIKKWYSFLWASALGATGIVALVLLVIQKRLQDVKTGVDSNLAGNPLQGFADAMIGSVQMQWGWIVLILGCAILLFGTYLKQRRPGKDTFITLAAAIALFIAISIVAPSIDYANTAAKAKETEAKQYVGSINRGQQIHFLEKDTFSWQLEDLGLGLKAETENYRYQITAADKEKAVVTATAKTGGIRSYAGGAFAVTNSASETNTLTIVCLSDRPTQTALNPPTLNGTEPQCASGSSKLDK